MSTYIEKRRQLWYATLKVPAHLHGTVGCAKFLKSLGTSDKRKAADLARPFIVQWKKRIKDAERETPGLLDEALALKAELLLAKQEDAKEEDPHDANAAFNFLELLEVRTRALEKDQGADAADQYWKVVTGKATPTSPYVSTWEASICRLEQKTQDQMKKDVQRLTARFQTVESITPAAVREWVKALTRGDEGLSRASIKRMGGAWRSFWTHLLHEDAAPEGPSPFAKVEEMAPALKAPRGQVSGWVPFPAPDVCKLVQAAKDREDHELADLITLGAFTGARIEELCSLKVVDVGTASFHIRDAKTQAGVREVPIHTALTPLVKRLKEASTDGYILAGLTLNKYGDRSNAIGKRFGRLKTAMGYGPQHVFHSLRKTLVTLLEDSGVSENLAADIVGHEKPRITYGLYSAGASLKTKTTALALVQYLGLGVS
jgi:integrase